MRLLIAPGLWLQGLTTRPPEASMLEVAIAALQRLLEEEHLIVPGEEAVGVSAVGVGSTAQAEG
jgi:uncharacterized protein YqhQ